jgi:hypothetical protein
VRIALSVFIAVLAGATVAFASTAPSRSTLSIVVKGRGHVTGRAGVNCRPSCLVRTREGKKLTLRARAVAGWKFSHWSFACRGTKPTCTVTMSTSRHVKATFVAR